jgi:acetyl esterase/lipase
MPNVARSLTALGCSFVMTLLAIGSFAGGAEPSAQQTQPASAGVPNLTGSPEQGAKPAQPQRPRFNGSGPQQARPADAQHVFKTTPQGELKVHVYLPPDWKAEDKRPAIVFWFGGGFTKGTVGAFSRQSEYFARRGLVCICPEYRIKSVHNTDIDSCVEDARSAMRWIKTQASQFGIDPEKIIAGGGSAGGTLALTVALAEGPNAKDDDLTVSPRPCALLLFNPAQGPAVAGNVQRIEGDDERRDRVTTQLAAIDRPQKNQPPALFLFGTDDFLLESSRKFCRQSLEQGSRCELWTAEGQKHAFFHGTPWYEATLRKCDEFLGALGYVQGLPTVVVPAEGKLTRELPAAEASSAPTAK